MPEITSNIEFAHKVHEEGHDHEASCNRWAHRAGVAESVVLSIVAVATAWSGYQAAKWDALSSKHTLASLANDAAQEKATLAGQDRLYDIVTFNGWVAATKAGNDKLAAIYERRFRPEYGGAFQAWQKLDPFNNPAAPPGPVFMAEYQNGNAGELKNLLKKPGAILRKA
jgi:hypothetical protein